MLSQYKCNIQDHIDEQIIGVCQSPQLNLQQRRVCKQCIIQLQADETFQLSDVKNEDGLNIIIQEYKSKINERLENVSRQSQIHRLLLVGELQEFVYYWSNEYYKWTLLESLSQQTKDKYKTLGLQQYLDNINNDDTLQRFLEKQSFKEINDIQLILEGKWNFLIQQQINKQKVDFVENFQNELIKLTDQIDDNLKIHNQEKLKFMITQKDNQNQLLNIYEKFEYSFLNQKEDIQQIIRQKQPFSLDDYISDYFEQQQLCRKGKLISDFGEFNESLNYFDQIIKLFPKNYQTYHNKAQTFIKQQKYQEALECYDQFIKIDPTYYDAYFDKADLYQQQNLFTDALLCYDRCIEIDLFNYRAYQKKAHIYEDQNKYIEAIGCHDSYIKINPTYYDAYYLKGQLLRYQNQLEESIQTYDQYLKIDPNHYYAHSNKAYLLIQQNKTKEAIECYDKCIQINPDKYEAYQNKAQIYEKENNLYEILQTYDAYISVVKNNYDPYYQKAQIFQNQQKQDEAILCYQQFLENDPNHFDALVNLASLLNNQNRFKEAQKYFEQCIKVDPTNFYVYNQRAQILIMLNNEVEAIQTYDQFIQVDPTLYESYYNKAEIYINQQNYQSAIECYDSFIKINPSNYQAYSNKALIFEKLQNNKGAIECYNSFILSNPTNNKVGEFQCIMISIIRINNKVIESIIMRDINEILQKNQQNTEFIYNLYLIGSDQLLFQEEINKSMICFAICQISLHIKLLLTQKQNGLNRSGLQDCYNMQILNFILTHLSKRNNLMNQFFFL